MKAECQVVFLFHTEENIAVVTVSKGSRDVGMDYVGGTTVCTLTVMEVLFLLAMNLSPTKLMAVTTNLSFFLIKEPIPFHEIHHGIKFWSSGPSSEVSCPNSMPEVLHAYLLNEIGGFHVYFLEQPIDVIGDLLPEAILVTSFNPPLLPSFSVDEGHIPPIFIRTNLSCIHVFVMDAQSHIVPLLMSHLLVSFWCIV